MGIYDRDYYRDEHRGFSWGGPRTIVSSLVLLNVLLYLANGLLTPPSGALGDLGEISKALAFTADSLSRPWLWWRLLTYGFVHAPPPQYTHLIFNMLVLWFLGRDVESLYGRGEFLRLYLVLLLAGSLFWGIAAKLQGMPSGTLLGASGAISGIVVLYALNFPRRTLLLFFVIPVPAWVVGVLLVGFDLYGAIALRQESNIAYTVHLAGAALAFLYFQFRWNFGRVTGSWLRLDRLKRRPRLRVHDPEPEQESDLHEEVDRILEKIHREGETSLTRKERRILETASRQYQKRRQKSGGK
jgi:membrane associated rhomboid family serine protease